MGEAAPARTEALPVMLEDKVNLMKRRRGIGRSVRHRKLASEH